MPDYAVTAFIAYQVHVPTAKDALDTLDFMVKVKFPGTLTKGVVVVSDGDHIALTAKLKEK